MKTTDTIFALSSGSLPAGVAVVRISGPHTADAVRLVCRKVPVPRQASLMVIRGADGEELDRGLVLFFEGPASFTGEDCAELQVHGGRAVVFAVLETLSGIEGLRQAEAGEFARRAFENGKMDLVEAEGLAELVQAETAAQRRLAKYLADGHLSRRYDAWMKRLSQARALIEAELDFTDEGDIPGSVSDQVWQDMQLLADEMAAALDDHTAEIVWEGFRVAFAGPPNAGKSSLMNFLAKRDVAIVTDIAGTTRDVLSVDLDLDGNRIVLFDTAGLRETEDPVERIGIERARQTINAADLVLHLVDLSEPTSLDLHDTSKLDSDMIVVRTKRDLHHPAEAAGGLSVSTVTGEGVDSLLKQILQRASVAVQGGQLVTPLLIRHRNHISAACDWVRAAGAAEDHALELRAEMLRSAADDLAHLTGRVTPDALLGLIFSQFCVGK